jgi:hypothetical protein
MSYFVPFLFLVTVVLILALITTAKKFILGEEQLFVGKLVSYFLITLSFYTMELVIELNEQIIRR